MAVNEDHRFARASDDQIANDLKFIVSSGKLDEYAIKAIKEAAERLERKRHCIHYRDHSWVRLEAFRLGVLTVNEMRVDLGLEEVDHPDFHGRYILPDLED